jgi:hypothetical protein
VKPKKGQVALFAVVGILILVLVGFTLYTRTNIFLVNPSEDDLNAELDSIRTHVQECIKETADGDIGRPIVDLGLQGGYLKQGADTFRLYNDDKISYLCYNMEGTEQCMNRMLLKKDMEQFIADDISEKIGSCLDVQGFRKLGGFDIITGDINVITAIEKDNVRVSLDYPIALKSKRSAASVSAGQFNAVINYPLGDLYDVANTIIDFETEFGDFDQFAYMLQKKGKYIIEKKKPYPDKLYIISRRDSSYVFQFFVQGEPE